MKNVITAIGNSMLNKKIAEMENCKILVEDISNDIELIEILQIEKNIDILFLHKSIINQYSVEDFFYLIREINENIMIILFDNNSNLKENQYLKIYKENQIEFEEFSKILNFKTESKINKEAIVISITGANGVGKSTFSTFLAKNVENKKTLLIDFDLDENNVKTILKLKKYNNNSNDIKDLIIKVNDNLDILCNLKKVYSDKNFVNFFTVQKLLKDLKLQYDFIIIDTSSNLENDYTKRIFLNSDKIICLLEPNILGIKKLKSILEIYENDWKINKDQIEIVINKSNIYEINENVIGEIFLNYKILGKIKYNDKYNLMINKDINKKEIKKEYTKIVEKVV